MPIRIVPFESIDASLIESLRERRAREERTLEFKRELNLTDRDTRSEFLKDVAGFANGSGGTLLYGVEEGDGEDEGMVVGLPGLELSPDGMHRQIDELLQCGIDERLMGVLHRAVPKPGGLYYYVIRVPPSPLAPHMIRIGKHSWQFYLRASTTTNPMDAREIKETVLRASSVFDRARTVVEERQSVLRARATRPPEDGGRVDHPDDDSSQVVLHVVPLFAAPGGFALTDEKVVDRLTQVSILGWTAATNTRRYTLEGLYVHYDDRARAGYFRSGAAEFQSYGIQERALRASTTDASAAPTLQAWQIEQQVLRTLDECAGLTTEGLLPLPLLVCVTLAGVKGSKLQPSPDRSLPSHGRGIVAEDMVSLTPILLNSWDRAAAAQVQGLFAQMFQAWGLPRSTNYLDGRRVWWNEHGRVAAPEPRSWTTGWEAGF